MPMLRSPELFVFTTNKHCLVLDTHTHTHAHTHRILYITAKIERDHGEMNGELAISLIYQLVQFRA